MSASTESHGREVEADVLRARIEAAIIEVIDRDDHYCIAYSEGQACCIDPRPLAQYRQKLTEPLPEGHVRVVRGYGGEAVEAGLIDRLVEIFLAAGVGFPATEGSPE